MGSGLVPLFSSTHELRLDLAVFHLSTNELGQGVARAQQRLCQICQVGECLRGLRLQLHLLLELLL